METYQYCGQEIEEGDEVEVELSSHDLVVACSDSCADQLVEEDEEDEEDDEDDIEDET